MAAPPVNKTIKVLFRCWSSGQEDEEEQDDEVPAPAAVAAEAAEVAHTKESPVLASDCTMLVDASPIEKAGSMEDDSDLLQQVITYLI